jgi:hypothetical protein
MGSKMLPMIWGTYMKLVTKYQISAININGWTEVKQYTPLPLRGVVDFYTH